MLVYELRRERLRALLKEVTAADLSRRSGIAASTISRYLKEPGEKGAKNISEKNARRVESAGGKPEHWLDKPINHSIGWGRETPQARPVSFEPWTLPPLLRWEALMQAGDLPAAFTVAVPDDALAPSLVRGTEVVFKRAERAEPGQCVVVEDRAGARYMRRYTQEPGGAWGAEAINKVYLSLHSETDGLKLLAVMAWRAESRI